jgi:hypothetical protein
MLVGDPTLTSSTGRSEIRVLTSLEERWATTLYVERRWLSAKTGVEVLHQFTPHDTHDCTRQLMLR